jgi:RNA polymerase sigma factor (sigma-70 family)
MAHYGFSGGRVWETYRQQALLPSPKTQPDGTQDAYACQKGRGGAAAMGKLLDHLLLQMTDEELMVLGCNGDEKAFKEIYKRHKVRLILYISRYLGRHNAIAEDLFHDVWENLLKHREDYVPRAKFTTYLYTIAHNVVFDYFRRNKVEVDYFRRENGVWALPERGDEAEPEPREEPDIGISMDLEKALGQLSVEQREAFTRHKRDGMTIPEIAKAAHEPADTVKSRYHYARAKLQGLLRSYKA